MTRWATLVSLTLPLLLMVRLLERKSKRKERGGDRRRANPWKTLALWNVGKGWYRQWMVNVGEEVRVVRTPLCAEVFGEDKKPA